MEFHEIYQLENISKTVDFDGLKVILFEGSEASGKSTVLKIFIDRNDKNSIILFNCDENNDLEKFLSILYSQIQKNFLKYKDHLIGIFSERISEKITLEYLTKLLDTVSDYRKVIILIENIENACEDLLKAITFMSMSLKKKRIMIVLTYNTDKRNDYVEDFILKLGIYLDENFKIIKMDELTMNEEKKILENMGYNIPDYVMERIHELTEGNIRKLTRLVSALKDKGYIDVNGYWVGSDLNFSMDTMDKKGFIDEKLKRMDSNTVYLLKILSIIGTKFSLHDIEEITGMNEFLLVDAIDRLIREGLIVEKDQDNFSFTDEDFQSIVYNNYVENEIKNRMHLKIAEYYDGKDNIMSAIHYYRAGIKDKAEKYLLNAAIEYANSYNYKKALEFLDMLSSIVSLNENALLIKGICYLKISEFSKALSIFDSLDNDSAKIYKAYTLAYIGEFSKAEEIISEIKNNDENVFHKEFIRAYIISRRFYLKDALEIFEKLLEMAQRIGKDDIIGDVFREIGNIHYYEQKYDLAKENYIKALEYYRKISYYEGIARIYNNLALIEVNTDVENGFHYYNEAIKFAGLSGNDSLLIVLHYNLADTYFWLGRVSESLREIEIATKISEYKNKIEVRHTLYSFLTDFYIYSGNFHKAIEYINEAIKISENIGSIFYYNLYKIKRSSIWTRMGVDVNTDEIMESYENVMKISEENGKILAGPYVGLIKLYRNEKDAINILEDSFESAFKAGDITKIVLPASNLMFAYILNGDLEKFKDLWLRIKDVYEKNNVNPVTFQIFEPVFNYMNGKDAKIEEFENRLMTENLLFLVGIMHLSYYTVSKNEVSKSNADDIFKRLALKNYEKYMR